MANVLNYGADPTGVADSTAQFLAAIAATPVSGTVCCPPTAAGFTYLIQPDAIDIAGRKLRGGYAHATQHSTLKCSIAGTDLLLSSGECAIEALELDGDSKAQNALHLVDATQSAIIGVQCSGALDQGCLIEGGEKLYIQGLFCQFNENGIRVVGADQSEFFACNASNNNVLGLYVAGAGSGLTTQKGSIKWFGGTLDVNATGPQALIDGCEGLLMSGVYIEGTPKTGLVHLDNGTSASVFEHLRFVLGDSSAAFAMRLINASRNTFIGCSAGGVDSRRIFIDGNVCIQNNFIGCYRASLLANDYMRLWFEDSPGNTWEGTQRNGGLVSASGTAPTCGTWEVGDVVWNDGGGAPTGWRCTVAGQPGTWTAF